MNKFSALGLAAAAMAAVAGPVVAADKPLTERNETLESAVSTPVEDLNIKKTTIPEVLVRAQANPYDLAATQTCETIALEVAALDEQLGEDHDDLAMAGKVKETQKGPTAQGLLKAGVASAIPFRGIVRQLTGAASHDKAVDAAIDAGFARRGFLKGRALEMNCAPPASPAWYTPKAEPPPAVVAQATEAATTAPVADTVAETQAERPTVEAAPLAAIPGAVEAPVYADPAPAAATPTEAAPAAL